MRKAWRVLRYRRNIRRLPHYSMTSLRIPVSRHHLFLGKGFLWDQRHIHRLMQTHRPEFRLYVDPTPLYQWARRCETRLEHAPRILQPLARTQPKAWDIIVQLEARLNDRTIPRHMTGREKRVVAIEQYLSEVRLYDPVLDGLRSAVRYDRSYFDKIVASLLPLLEKLTTDKIAQLLAPSYSELNDPRPIFDWMQTVRQRAVVYVGLDALSDTEVASAVGNAMFSDLVSVAGQLYKFGIDDGLPPSADPAAKVPINLHADEFNELMGDEFIPLVNKGGGAGIQVTAYTQTLSDIEARLGNHAKAGQVVDNFNNLFVLRVRETDTAELLTRQLPKVEVYASSQISTAADNFSLDSGTDFSSTAQERVTATSMPLIEPAHIVSLPKGQCFALVEGGKLWKIRMPLPEPDPDEAMPASLQAMAKAMRLNHTAEPDWWQDTSQTDTP